jgi:hypothetical protein
VFPPLVVQVLVSTNWAGFEVALATTVLSVLAAGAFVVSARWAQLLVPLAVVVQVAVRVEGVLAVVALGDTTAAAGVAVRVLPISALPASAVSVRVHRVRMRALVFVFVWVSVCVWMRRRVDKF